jgi:hypothetical protein
VAQKQPFGSRLSLLVAGTGRQGPQALLSTARQLDRPAMPIEGTPPGDNLDRFPAGCTKNQWSAAFIRRKVASSSARDAWRTVSANP